MRKTKKYDMKKILGAVGIGAALAFSGGAIGANVYPEKVTNPLNEQLKLAVGDLREKIGDANDIIKRQNGLIEDLKNVEPEVITNEVEVEVEVEKIVEVDNGNLELVLEHIYDNEGMVSYLTEDLDDDEIDLMVDRVKFMNEIKDLSIAEVKAEGIDELDKEILGDVTFDEDDIEKFKIYDDHEDIVVEDVDFEDSDADLIIQARFEQDDVDYIATFKVEISEGEVDNIEVLEIALK